MKTNKFLTIVIRNPQDEEGKKCVKNALAVLHPYQTAISMEDEITTLEMIEQHPDFDESIAVEAREQTQQLHAEYDRPQVEIEKKQSSTANIGKSTEQTLDMPARVRGVVFNPGVNIMTVIHAAQRCFEEYVPEDAAGIKEEILRGQTKTEDRKMLEYLMQQFNFEEWNCDRCGWSESTSKCDSADLLRRYLAGDKAAMRRLSKDLQDDLLAIDNFPQPSGNSEQLPDWPEDEEQHPQRGLGQS